MNKAVRLGSILIVALLLVSLPALSASKQVVRFLSGETDPESVEIHKQIIKEFEAQNPDIQVELELVATDEREKKIIADLFSGVPVGLIQVDSENIGYYAKNGVLMELDSLIQDIGVGDFLPGSRFTLNGHDWGMPYAGANIALFIRTDLFKSAGLKEPKTWSELVNAARKLTTKNRYGIVVPAGQNACTTLWFHSFINQTGGVVFDEDLNPTLNTPEVVKALKFYRDLAKYAPPGIASYSYGDNINAYVADKVAMAYYQGRLLSRIASDAPHLLRVTKVIKPPVNNTNVNFSSYVYYAIGKKCEYPEATMKFLKFLTTGDRSLRFSMTVPGHMPPALKSVRDLLPTYKNAFVQQNLETIQFFFGLQDTGFNEVVNAGGIKNNKVVRTGIINPYYGLVRTYNVLAKMVQQVVIEGKDPEAVAKQGQEELVRLVNQERAKK